MVGIVRFAYVVISLLLIIPIVLFTLAFFLGAPSFLMPTPQTLHRENRDGDELSKDGTHKTFRTRLLIGGFVLFFLYQPVEGSLSNFLAVFVVKGLGWPNGHGSLITSVFWTALGMGRGLSIPVAPFLSPTHMLMGSLGITFVGAALLIFSPYHVTFVWVSAAVAGMGMGPFFAAGYVWLSQYISITGWVSSLFVAASAVAGIANPYIVGYLLDNYGHMSLPYYETAAVASFLLTYLSLQLFATSYTRKVQNRSNERTEFASECLIETKDIEMTLLSSGSDRSVKRSSVPLNNPSQAMSPVQEPRL